VKFEGVAPVTVRLVKKAFVAKRFVDVELVEVVFPKYPFHRFVTLPRLKARSVVGMRFEETVPETVRVEVTVRVEALAPPKRESVVVVKAPRLETIWRVSDSVVAGQPTPFARQIFCPITVAVAKVPMFPMMLVAVAVPKVPVPVMLRLVPVAPLNVR